jgi:hypothetical protein
MILSRINYFAFGTSDVEMRNVWPNCNNESYSWDVRDGQLPQLGRSYWLLEAERGYLSPAIHSMMDGARALPTGSLNKVISSYSVILTTILNLLLVE